MSVAIARKGFTLVEILIVVIILGILAAIVIPQFTDASETAKTNSLSSQVQTIRSQVELFKSAHSSSAAGKLFNTTTTEATLWQELLKKTDIEGNIGTTAGTHIYGPYLQSKPVNNLNGKSLVQVATVADESTFNPDDTAGFVYDSGSGKFWATNKDFSKLAN